MAYTKIVFQNSPSTATPLNAENLNHMDDQIALNDQRLSEIETNGVVSKFNGRSGNVTPEKGDYDISKVGASDGQDGYVPVWRNNGTEQEPDWGFAMEEMGGSGHEIINQDGTTMAQEDALQFADSFLTDDSENGRTVVENIKEVAPADYDSTTDEGIIVTDDGDDALIGPVSDDYVEVEGDGTKTYGTLLNELGALIDKDKISADSYLIDEDNAYIYRIIVSYTTFCDFFYPKMTAGTPYFSSYRMRVYYSGSDSQIQSYDTNGQTSHNSDILANNKKLRLYYGNRKATVDLQTTANRCWYDEENTVANMLSSNDISNKVTKSSSYTFSVESFKKMGNLVIISIQASGTFTAGALNQLLTLDSSIRPSNNRFATFTGSDGGGTPITSANCIVFSNNGTVSAVPIANCSIVAGTIMFALN